MSDLPDTGANESRRKQPSSRLSAAAASRICMDQCKAMCCRGPLILRLNEDEVPGFLDQAHRIGVEVKSSRNPGGGGWVRFSDHPGERCPMLDDATSACRIYDDRPQRCRDFPEKLIPGCAISEYLEPPASPS